MADKKADFLELFQRNPRRENAHPNPEADSPPKGEEDECPAFGYLRGLDARALGVELRFLDGNSVGYSYSLFASWRYNPSVGLLLKFTSDVTTLVLIRGSNLDAVVGDTAINLTDRGFQRHRILWVREMDQGETRQVGQTGPTIDRIEVGEFEEQAELHEWLTKTTPGFARS